MTKMVTEINFNFTFDTAHKGAPYTIDGVHYMNAGEFKEIVAKSVNGFTAHKDANTRFDEGSDIPELNASVKSSGATLVNMKLADTFDEFVRVYFDRVHSTSFIWVSVIESTATLYTMDADEFRTFLYKFAGLNERGVVRFKKESGKMIAFLESLA